jgi:hypothetical protein
MIRYDLIRLGQPCPARCPFCDEHKTEPRSFAEIRGDIEKARPPLNLNFGHGDASAFGKLPEVLRGLLLEDIRRIRIKATGPALLDRRYLDQLISLGAMQYEVECLGDSARLHDRITGLPGSFRTMSKIVKLLKGLNVSEHPIHRPFLIVSVPICAENANELRKITELVLKWRPDRIVYRNTGTCAVSRIVFELQICCAQAVIEGVWPVLSGFPFCTVPGMEYYCQEIYDPQISREKGPGCQPCILREACCGIPPGYLDSHGAAEFPPIRTHRYAEEIGVLTCGVPMIRQLLDRQSGTDHD